MSLNNVIYVQASFILSHLIFVKIIIFSLIMFLFVTKSLAVQNSKLFLACVFWKLIDTLGILHCLRRKSVLESKFFSGTNMHADYKKPHTTHNKFYSSIH